MTLDLGLFEQVYFKQRISSKLLQRSFEVKRGIPLHHEAAVKQT